MRECERDIERDDAGVSMSRERLTGTADVKGKRYEMNVLVAWRTFCSSQISLLYDGGIHLSWEPLATMAVVSS